MDFQRMFEDIEAQVVFEDQGQSGIADLLASTRVARIVVNAEGIVVTNMVFGRDFLLATNRDTVVAVPICRIELLEVLTVYDSARSPSTIRLHQWISQTLVGRSVRIRAGLADAAMAGEVIDCDKDWLLVEQVDGSTKSLVSMRSILVIEIKAVHNYSDL